ncbi:MAG TPA: phosphoglycerate kinase [Kiritimatiellia bacterium]|nr:MAG: Phosphoglycerate kinase [Verrucomicrobia bacterium ADurb.Bin018]HOD99985.1 phosphoglycerate kinase [Kiritimatiellia bacterium]HOE36272.1 phosphoglycerate kinase [Kiritimatiellia bacterium]HOR73716.1 phosphoglycerate kinase [Kiritimatiellia bacterium]HOU58278.1 phosphoglycerate kinase [Kiritimatiellia bacterium]
MNKKTLQDVELSGKRVVMRVDFNVPLKNGVISDDTRIQAALPSIRHILGQGARLVLMSHLGRPKGKGYEAEFSLKPVAEHLAKVLGQPVAFAADCLAADAEVAALQPGQVLLLENTRFYKEEEAKVKKTDDISEEDYKAQKAALKEKQKAMAKKLASYGDVFVNDAFGAAHRAHASTAVICKYIPVSVSGFLLEKEIRYLGNAVNHPERPFVAILGGAKVSDKLAVVNNLLDKVDTLIIGGGMAYTFLKAQGHDVGQSLCELDQLDYARDMLAKAKANGKKLLLPVDNVAADKFAADAATQVVGNDIPAGWMALDIGPKTIAAYAAAIQGAKTVVWNGPMGCFEMAPFAAGTFGVCEAVAASGATSIIGGGDSVSAVNKSGLAAKMTHISTGGGASLEYLEGKELPGVAALSDK